MEDVLDRHTGHGGCQRCLVPGFRAQITQLSEGSRHIGMKPSPCIAAQGGPRGYPHRQPAGVRRGQSIRNLAGALPAELGGSDVAVGRPRARTHMPFISSVQLTRGLEMLRDQRSILVVVVDRRGQPSVQLNPDRL